MRRLRRYRELVASRAAVEARTGQQPAYGDDPLLWHDISFLPCRATFPWSRPFVVLHHSTCACRRGERLLITRRDERRFYA